MYEQDNNKMCNVCYEYECKGRKDKGQRKCCIDVIIFVLSILLALTVGLIIGSIPAVATVLFEALATLIILAIILLVLIILRAVELVCDRCKNNKC